MKRTIAVLAAGSLLLAAPAVAAPKPRQTQEGTIVLPTPNFQDPADCFAGYHRRFAFFSQEQVNGPIGYHFDIDKTTWGGKFVLEPTGGQGVIDLDIVFYESFDSTDPLGGPVSVEVSSRKPGGETGLVPINMNKAIVCLWAGDQHQGALADFKYEAFTPAKRKRT